MGNVSSLLQPLRVKNTVFRNRIFFGPVQMSAIDGSNYPTDYSIDFFAARARGGAAVVTVGDTPVDSKYAPNSYRHFVLDDPGALPMLTTLTDSIKCYGAVPSIELNHAGAFTQIEFLQGGTPIGPSSFKRPDGVQVTAMNRELLDYTIESYSRAAAFAKLAGFEMITVCSGDGWLLHQFLSGVYNHRRDRYGGTVENRMNFPLEVLQAVRRQLGEEFLIELRICGSDYTDNGINEDEAVAFAQEAAKYVDLIQVTAGSDNSTRTASQLHPTIFMPHLPHKELARHIKQAVSIPVVMNGGVMTPEEGASVLDEGCADAVSMCRAQIADPDAARKAIKGELEEIRPCIRCLRCLGDMQRTKEFHCTVNPSCGREHLLARQPPRSSDGRIVVVGGGPAGLTAALTTAQRGCRVTLFEKEKQLGGQLKYIGSAPHSEDLRRFTDHLIRTVQEQRGINLILGIEASPELVQAQQPDGVIAAIGGNGSIPTRIRGQMGNILDCGQVYSAKLPQNQKIVVLGGGETGCRAALFLGSRGHQVTVLERKKVVMPSEQPMLRYAWTEQLQKAGVVIRAGVNCTRIGHACVTGYDADSQASVDIPADLIVFATGNQRAIGESERFRPCAGAFASAGACIHSGDLKQVIYDGFCAGRYIDV